MPVTQTDVANMALDILTEGAIDSLAENSKPARLLNRHWDVVIETELRERAWHFATFSEEIEGEDTGLGDGTLNWKYELPDDALRVLPLTYDGQAEGVPISFRQEGGYLYTDQDSPRTIRYIANVTDPNEWDANFTEVVAAALAVKIAHPLTGKAGLVAVAKEAYRDAVAKASRAHAFERAGRLYRESWHVERGDTRFYRP